MTSPPPSAPEARPGDVVAYCPDQLGPAVSRLLPGAYVQLTYPRSPSHPRSSTGSTTRSGRRPATRSRSRTCSTTGPAPGHAIFLVWSGAYRTHVGLCEQIVDRLSAVRPATRVVAHAAGQVLRERGAAPVPARGEPRRPAGRRRADRGPAWLGHRPAPRGRRPGAVPLPRRRAAPDGGRSRGPGPPGPAVMGRLLVRAHRRARVRRRCPTRASGSSPSSPSSAAGSPTSRRSTSAPHSSSSPTRRPLALGLLLYRLVCLETGDGALARRAVWLVALAPPAYVFVMGYTEATASALAVATFLALRTRRWGCAALSGALAGLARPVGVLLVVPAVIEATRGRRTARPRQRGPRLLAALAPAAGAGAYLGWVQLRFGDWLLSVADPAGRHNLRGALAPTRSPPSTAQCARAAERPRGRHRVARALGDPARGWGRHRLPALACVVTARSRPPARRRGLSVEQPRLARALRRSARFHSCWSRPAS